jgi:peptidoglycan hydrolase CwlO-like protein
MINYSYLICIVVFLLTIPAHGIDFDDCSINLTKIAKISKEASEITDELDDLKNEMDSKNNDLESEKHKLKNCMNYPETYDLLNDGCSSINSRYKYALEDFNNSVENYNSKIKELEDLMDELKSEIKKLEYNTGYTF